MMRNMMDLFHQENPFDYVTTDARFPELMDAIAALRGYNPHEKMTRAEYNEMKAMQHSFTECVAGLSNDYDIPAEVVRQFAVHTLKSRDN